MKLIKKLVSVLIVAAVAIFSFGIHENESFAQTENLWPRSETQIPSDEEQVEKILAQMSLKDKVGQLIMAEIRHVTPRDVKRYRLGGILNGGGAFPNNNKNASASEWVALADKFYQASIDRKDGGVSIPVLWGTDAVHGHNNVYGATIFPHNIGLGATGNPDLIEKIGAATAKEVLATGIYWSFAPTVTVPKDDRWGRTYEGYAEEIDLVKSLSAAMIEGLQGRVDEDFLGKNHVIATAKHFIGDGGTQKGVDQGNTRLNEAALSKLHGQGYFSAMDKGVQTVMASFNSWNGKKIHGDEYLLTDVLKKQMGFDGFVVGDWNGHGQIPGCTNASCAQAINAGVDMIMVPEDWEAFYKNTLKQARSGTIPAKRLDDAVKRILRVKLRLGMFTDGGPKKRPNAGKQEVIGHPEHRAIARQAVRESLVLLKNNQEILPLNPAQNILVVGEAAESIANQLGGWSLTWQGTQTKNSDFPGATRIVDGIEKAVKAAGGQFNYSKTGHYAEKPDVAFMFLAEPPYAEGPGDRTNVAFSPENRTHIGIMQKLQSAGIPVVTIFLSGRALWVNQELNHSDAFVAAWLPGTEGQGVADVLFCAKEQISKCGFKGKTSFSWPQEANQTPLNYGDALYDPLFAFGYGLEYGQSKELGKLKEGVRQTNVSALGSTLFKGRGIPPYSAVIQEQGLATISASQSQAQTKNRGVVTSVFDRKLQEDAQRISFSGQGLNSWQLQSGKKQNWQVEAQQEGQLVLDIRVKKNSEEPIYASMVCGSGCNASLAISESLKTPAFQNWQSVSFSLACLEKQGADLTNITHPLVFLTAGDWAFEVSNIRLLNKNTVVDHKLCQ